MKILITLLMLFTFDALACSTLDQALVNSCTVENKFMFLFQPLYPSHSGTSIEAYEEAEDKSLLYAFAEQVYASPSGAPTLTMYERLTMENKPALSVLEDELTTWKALWIERLNFKDSVNSIDNLRERAILCGYTEVNMGKFKLNLIKSMDTAKLDCLISKESEASAKVAQLFLKQQIRKDLQFAKSLEIDFVMGLRQGPQNTGKNKRLLTKLADLRGLLSVGDIDGAKEELTSIQTDADFSQASKDVLLSKMNSYLGQ